MVWGVRVRGGVVHMVHAQMIADCGRGGGQAGGAHEAGWQYLAGLATVQ